MLPTVRITRGGLRLQSNNPIIISSSSTGKKNMRPADSALGIFRSPDHDLCVPGRRILRPREPCYGLHKQIAHWSVHGKTYNKTCTKRRISLHTLSLHISSLIRAFANRMYLLQSLGLTKRLVRRAKTRVNLPTAHSDKNIRRSYLSSIAGLSKVV